MCQLRHAAEYLLKSFPPDAELHMRRDLRWKTTPLIKRNAALGLFDWVRTSQQCVCIYTAVYSQTLTAISIFKYVNIVCVIQVHILSS